MKVAAATLLYHRVLRWNELELPKPRRCDVAHLKGCLSRNRFFDVFVSCFFFEHPFAGLVGVFCVVFFFVVGCWLVGRGGMWLWGVVFFLFGLLLEKAEKSTTSSMKLRRKEP